MLRHHQGDPGFVRRIDHAPAAFQRVRHRLLGEHMLAGLRRRNGLRSVVAVTGADVHRIDVGLRQHFAVVGEDGFDAGFAPRNPRRAVGRCRTRPVRRTWSGCLR